MKSLSNSVTKFYDQGICEEFYVFRHKFSSLILLFLVVIIQILHVTITKFLMNFPLKKNY